MSSLTLLAAVAPTRLDPIRLFLDADIVVQLVMAGLLLASIWVWMIIVSFSLRMRKLRSRTIAYEGEFWEADSFDRLTSERGNKDIPAARVAQAAVEPGLGAVGAGPRARRARRHAGDDLVGIGEVLGVAVGEVGDHAHDDEAGEQQQLEHQRLPDDWYRANAMPATTRAAITASAILTLLYGR